jgi:hypothetical protein
LVFTNKEYTLSALHLFLAHDSDALVTIDINKALAFCALLPQYYMPTNTIYVFSNESQHAFPMV